MAVQIRKSCFFMVGILLMTCGCLMTKTEPSHQLEAEERIMSGSIDGSLASVVPRVQVGYTRGVGGRGDLSAHAGLTGITNLNVGGGGRLYVFSWLSASLQLDLGTSILGFSEFWATITPRLITSTDENRRVYGGIQANSYHATARMFRSDSSMNRSHFLIPGVVLGYDFRRFEGLQAELMVLPFVYDYSLRRILNYDDFGSPHLFLPPVAALSQISVSHHWSNLDSQVDQLEPTEEPPAEESF